MGATFLMSYPGPSWTIRGGANFRSQERAPTNPRAAMQEWLGLCDAITRAGGTILVMPPKPATPPLSGMIYTANAGALFRKGDVGDFVVSQMAVNHRQDEHGQVSAFFREAGVAALQANQVWEGQADICSLAGSRYILTWGVRSVQKSVDEIRTHLPPGARTLALQLREPFFHGDTCLNPIKNRVGDHVLLAHAGAFVDHSIQDVRDFVGSYAEVFPVDEDDALGYACNALSVDGTLLIPTGLSTALRGQLVRRGFTLQELELGELFGKGGGGPRCLVNELHGFVADREAPTTYLGQRSRLQQLAESYPESVATPAPTPVKDSSPQS